MLCLPHMIVIRLLLTYLTTLFQFKMFYSLEWDAKMMLNSEKLGIACYSNWSSLPSNSRTLALHQSVHCVCYLITRTRKLFCVDNKMLRNHVLFVKYCHDFLVLTNNNGGLDWTIWFIDHSFTITYNHNNWQSMPAYESLHSYLSLFCSVLWLTSFWSERPLIQRSVTCWSTRSLAMGLHVTIHLLNRSI
jgi:hypothetical protein